MSITEDFEEMGIKVAPRLISGPSCEVAFSPVPGVLVKKWNEEVWVLPWSHLIRARYLSKVALEDGGGDVEQITLSFSHETVTLRGRHLRRLMEFIVNYQLSSLTELAREFLDSEMNKEHPAPVVVSIQSVEHGATVPKQGGG